jgi:hypothetical protein
MKAIIISAKNSIRRPSLRRGSLLMPLLLACFGLAPMAQAVGPDTDGAIAGSNNGEGIGVLVNRITGIWNTGTGFEALNSLTSGNQNTATGLRALNSDINGGFNTATGVLSLFSNTSGFFNIATGAYSLANNTIGNYNTANGYGALYHNDTDGNTAVGFGALFKNTTGIGNVAVGDEALAVNNNPDNFGGSTAVGSIALTVNTSGYQNTAVGRRALEFSTTGINNTAVGWRAGDNVTTASGTVCIGVIAGANVDNTTYIRNVYETVQPVVGTDPDVVTVNSGGRLGRGNISSRRYKHDIKPMDKASEALLALKPVTFRYNKEYDATQTLAFGLIAEEVAEVYPDLVGRNREGQPESVRYEQINAMMLNEFLKEHQKVEELEATVVQQQKGMEVLAASLKEQAAQIQKVSARIEVNKPAPKTVSNK